MDNGRIQKYFLYAIGEIILVIIGILAALEINNWNSFRQDRALEKEYLSRMITDLKQDTASLANMIQLADTKRSVIEYILPYLVDKKREVKDSSQFINSFINSTVLGWAHYSVTSSTIEELKSTGHFVLIQNVSLRSWITKYYHDAESVYQRIDTRRGDYPSMADRLFPREEIEGEDAFDIRDDLMSKQNKLDKIRNSELDQLIFGELNLAVFINQRLTDLLNKSQWLLSEIDNELAKKSDR